MYCDFFSISSRWVKSTTFLCVPKNVWFYVVALCNVCRLEPITEFGLFIMLEWIKKQFKLLQEKSEQSSKHNGKEQKKKKPFEDSSSDDEDDLTPNLTNSQNKVKRKVMDSSSSDEEKAEVPSAKDKGEEEANLFLYYILYCPWPKSDRATILKYLLTHFPWSDLAAKWIA